jgi:hypothetical protein
MTRLFLLKSHPKMTNLGCYVYSTLPDANRYLRLLTLVSTQNQILCRLEIFPVHEAPPYQALSYAWGSEEATESVFCGSRRIPISPHLFEGLLCVQSTAKPPRLWVDAICINQLNMDEKASQIPLMTEIYGRAEKVLVWLGSSADQSDLAIDEIPSLYHKLHRAEHVISFGDTTYAVIGLPSVLNPVWRALGCFFSRDWFHRLWILQEVILAKQIAFVCDTKLIDFDLLASFSTEACRTRISSHIHLAAKEEDEAEGHHVLADLKRQREAWSTQTSDPLSFLTVGRYKKAREPVDHVYGLLGILPRNFRESIKVDYSAKSKEEYWRLYIATSQHMLRFRGVDVLVTAESCERPGGLPSWCTNWGSPPPSAGMSWHFHAGYQSDSFSPPDMNMMPDPASIKLSGFEVDEIGHTVGLEWQWSIDQAELRGPGGRCSRILKILNECFQLYQTGGTKVTHELMLESYARTLIANPYLDGVQEGKDSGHLREDYKWFKRYLEYAAYGKTPEGANWRQKFYNDNNVGLYLSSLSVMWKNRCFFVTKGGRIGLGSQRSKAGDTVCVFFSARHPYILRKTPGGSSHELISVAYVDGVMYGEALNLRNPSKDKEFVIS